MRNVLDFELEERVLKKLGPSFRAGHAQCGSEQFSKLQ